MNMLHLVLGFFRILSRKEELELKIESLAQKMKVKHFIDPKKYKDGDKEAKRFSSYSGWFDSTNRTDKLHTVEFISVLDRISKISSAFLLILQDMISDDELVQEPRGELQHLFASMVGMQDVVVWDLVTGTIFSYLSNEIRNQIFSNLGYQKESK